MFAEMEEGKEVFMELPPLMRLDGSRVGPEGDEDLYAG